MTRSLMDKIRGRNKPRTSSTDTLIDKATRIEGGATIFSGTLVVDGMIGGNVAMAGTFENSDDTLIVNGSIFCNDLKVKHIIVNGTLSADNITCVSLVVSSKGKVAASLGKTITYDSLSVVPGSVVVGTLKYSRTEAAVEGTALNDPSGALHLEAQTVIPA